MILKSMAQLMLDTGDPPQSPISAVQRQSKGAWGFRALLLQRESSSVGICPQNYLTSRTEWAPGEQSDYSHTLHSQRK